MVNPLRDHDNAGRESPDALLERLPELFREHAGGLRGVLRAVGAGRRELRELLRRVSIETGIDRVLLPDASLTESEPVSSQAPPTDLQREFSAGELAAWLERRSGRRPALWPGLRLTGIDGARLRISALASMDRPNLAVMWEVDADADADAAEVSAAIRERCRGLLPPGFTVQFASVRSRLPLNPHVDGLLLEGELL